MRKAIICLIPAGDRWYTLRTSGVNGYRVRYLEVGTVTTGTAAKSASSQLPETEATAYSLTIQRTLQETLEDGCPGWVAIDPFIVDVQEKRGDLRLVVRPGAVVWEGTIDAEGDFKLRATTFPSSWNIDIWSVTGTMGADRSTLAATEEFRGELEDDGVEFCHVLISWSNE